MTNNINNQLIIEHLDDLVNLAKSKNLGSVILKKRQFNFVSKTPEIKVNKGIMFYYKKISFWKSP